MFAFNKFSLIAIAATIGLSSMTAHASNTPNYHILDNAIQSIKNHQFNPSADTDPLIDAGKAYITLPPIQIERSDDMRIDLLVDSEVLIYDRKDKQDVAREILAQDLKAAIDAGDDNAIQKAYEDYHDNYRDGNLVDQIVIDNKITDIGMANNKALFDSTSGSVGLYRQATGNFINAYIQEMSSRRDGLYDDDYTNRMNNLIASNNRVEPIFTLAQNFSDDCSACELPPRQVAPEPDPVTPIVIDPVPPVYIEPLCDNIRFDNGMWSFYQCP